MNRLLLLAQGRGARVVLLLALCTFTAIQARMRWQLQQRPDNGAYLRSQPQWDSGGKILGNPQNAVSDLKAMHQALRIFHQRFKRYPQSSMELLNDMGPNHRIYGFASAAKSREIFANPDMIHSSVAMFRQRPADIIAYQMPAKRFDGRPIGSSKPHGQRDVVAWTELYYFPNIKVNWEGMDASTMNPVGFYVVLWDDGEVEKVPFDKALSVPQPNKEWKTGFPGQAGLIAGTKTFLEMNRNNIIYQNWQRTQDRQTQAQQTH
ncbi:MAG: hypothetical protein JWN98_2630 [Abditibacteriota bacterium]|nr:hypothetical protein [Abditibacteriota bacterium]